MQHYQTRSSASPSSQPVTTPQMYLMASIVHLGTPDLYSNSAI